MATKVTEPTTAASEGTICEGANRVFSITATRDEGETGDRWLYLRDGSTALTPGGIRLPPGGKVVYPFGGGGYLCGTDLNYRVFTKSQNATYPTDLSGTAQCLAQISDAPRIASIDPDTGSMHGRDEVTITGVGFTGASLVQFDGFTATNLTVVSDSEITCRTPGHADRPATLTVTTPAGVATLENAFTYTGFHIEDWGLTMFMEGDNLKPSVLVGSASDNAQSSNPDFFLESTGTNDLEFGDMFGSHKSVRWISDDTWTNGHSKTLGDYIADDEFTAIIILKVDDYSYTGSHYYDCERIIGQGGGGSSWGIAAFAVDGPAYPGGPTIQLRQFICGIKSSSSYKEITLTDTDAPDPSIPARKWILQFRLKDGTLSARFNKGAWKDYPDPVGTIDEMGYFLTSFGANDKAPAHVALLLLSKQGISTNSLDEFCEWAANEYEVSL